MPDVVGIARTALAEPDPARALADALAEVDWSFGLQGDEDVVQALGRLEMAVTDYEEGNRSLASLQVSMLELLPLSEQAKWQLVRVRIVKPGGIREASRSRGS